MTAEASWAECATQVHKCYTHTRARTPYLPPWPQVMEGKEEVWFTVQFIVAEIKEKNMKPSMLR